MPEIKIYPTKNGQNIVLRFKNDLPPGVYQGTNRGCATIGSILNFGVRCFVGEWGITLVPRWKSDIPRIMEGLIREVEDWRFQWALKCMHNRLTPAEEQV